MPIKRFMAECPFCGIIFAVQTRKIPPEGEVPEAQADDPTEHKCERCGYPLSVYVAITPDPPE